MRVVVLPSWFPDNKNPLSGIFVKEQALALSEVIDVTMLIFKRGFFKKTIFYKEAGLEICEHTVFYLPKINRYLIDIWANLYVEILIFQHRIKPIDLVHAHDHLTGYAAYKFHLKTKIPYVVTIHNTQFMVQSVDAWRKEYIRTLGSNATKIISVGTALYQRLLTDYSFQNLVIIPNFVDANIFELANEMTLKPARFNFVTIGALIESKGYDLLIKAFYELIERNPTVLIEVKIIGDGCEMAKLKNLVNILKLKDKIKFLGWQNRNNINKLLQQAHVFVSSSRIETFGIAVLEALACGLPCVVSKSGGPEYMINENNGVIVAKNDFQELSIAMEKLYYNYTKFDPLKIRTEALRKYEKNLVIQQIISLYKEVLYQKAQI